MGSEAPNLGGRRYKEFPRDEHILVACNLEFILFDTTTSRNQPTVECLHLMYPSRMFNNTSVG